MLRKTEVRGRKSEVGSRKSRLPIADLRLPTSDLRFLSSGLRLPSSDLSLCRRGVAAAEMAILLPFLGFMFLVALDYCRVFYATQTLWNCAQTAALYASGTAKASSEIGAEQAARQAALVDAVDLNPPLLPENVTVVLDKTTATVTVQYEFPLLTVLLGSNSSVVLQRTVTMGLAPLPGN
jgi:Flp pilus assembly protein TadG